MFRFLLVTGCTAILSKFGDFFYCLHLSKKFWVQNLKGQCTIPTGNSHGPLTSVFRCSGVSLIFPTSNHLTVFDDGDGARVSRARAQGPYRHWSLKSAINAMGSEFGPLCLSSGPSSFAARWLSTCFATQRPFQEYQKALILLLSVTFNMVHYIPRSGNMYI